MNLDLYNDAATVLEDAHYPCEDVVSVDGDSILFLGVLGKPHTAWIHRTPIGRLHVLVVDGFQATPPAGLHDGEWWQ